MANVVVASSKDKIVKVAPIDERNWVTIFARGRNRRGEVNKIFLTKDFVVDYFTQDADGNLVAVENKKSKPTSFMTSVRGHVDGEDTSDHWINISVTNPDTLSVINMGATLRFTGRFNDRKQKVDETGELIFDLLGHPEFWDESFWSSSFELIKAAPPTGTLITADLPKAKGKGKGRKAKK